ncbi:hypothetical protein TNCV_3515311 [Trichonephila clavipes]|nr:hypothetical protein TNCV_3515311 [Trichonephila clavipes]
MSKKRTTAAKVRSNLHKHMDSPVSMFTVRRYLHKQNIYARAAMPKPLVQVIMISMVYSNVTLTKPGRLINGECNMVCRIAPLSYSSLQQDGCTFRGHLHKRVIMFNSYQLSSMEVDLQI